MTSTSSFQSSIIPPSRPRFIAPEWLATDRRDWDLSVRTWLAEVAIYKDLGPIEAIEEIRVRPWSTVLRIRFDRGMTYFKANRSDSTFEGAVLSLLAQSWPERTPSVIEMDESRSWVLMTDEGESLLEAELPLRLNGLMRMLRLYAEMQVGSRNHLDELTACGVPDRRLERLPFLLEGLLDSDDLLFGRTAQEAHCLENSARRLLATLGRVCEVLARSAYSLTLDHGDIYVGNILEGQDKCLRLCDWGDACLTHPFCSISVTIEGFLLTAPEADRKDIESQLWAAYLEPWEVLSSPTNLQREAALASWVTPVLRALDFSHMFSGMDHEANQLWKPLIGRCLERWTNMPEPAIQQ